MYSKSNTRIQKSSQTPRILSCGISKADFEEAPWLENWLKKNQNGQMSFMSHFDKRLNFRRCWSKMLKV
jgi:epoxyqueuosine reductase